MNMKNILLFSSLGCSALTLSAQNFTTQQAVIKYLRTAIDYFMAKRPDPVKTIVTNKERPANIWTGGVYYEGLMAFYKIDKQKRYYDYAVEWAEKHHWKPVRGEVYTRQADNQKCTMN